MNLKDRPYVPIVLSVAGLDPSGGAGLYADMKTFSSLSVWGMGVPTVLTNQTSKEFLNTSPVDISYFKNSLSNILDSYNVSVLKIGLITSIDIVDAILECINRKRPGTIILDPVMFSSTGFRFWDEELLKHIKERLLPSIDIISPNVKEASSILSVDSLSFDKRQLAEKIYRLFRLKVAITGGDIIADNDTIEDVFYDGMDLKHRVSSFIDMPSHMKHGTGCSFSSALASYIALGMDFSSACFEAGIFVENALNNLVFFGKNDAGICQYSANKRR